VLAVWLVVEPLEGEKHGDHIEDDKEILRCSGDHAWIFAIILFSYGGALMFAGGVLAFLARKASSKFNESKFIGISIYNVIFCLVISIPLAFIMDGSPDASFLILTLGIFFAITGTLFILFIPKIYFIFKKKRQV